MRDRRNTNLSISTLSSSSDSSPVAVTAPTIPSNSQESETKRFLWVPPQSADAPLPSPMVKAARESKQPLLGTLRLKIGVKHLCVVSGLLFLFIFYQFSGLEKYFASTSTSSIHPSSNVRLVQGDALPDYPSAIIFKDSRGNQGWTVSIPESLDFPLAPEQYRDLCRSSEYVSKSVKDSTARSRIMGSEGLLPGSSYYATDRGFVDVAKAQGSGLMPMPSQRPAALVGQSNESTTTDDAMLTCDKTMTFVMETNDAGFGHMLLALWLSYGLARREGRAFFIDDTRWSYGSYLAYFQPPPLPTCAPPPKSHMLPCPHSANHLIVSTATIPWTFGKSFHDYFRVSRKSGFKNQRHIYDMLRAGHDDLFSLTGDDSTFVSQRLSSLSSTQEPTVGMHIRRGDRHPYESAFREDYLPLERFTMSAQELFRRMSQQHTTDSTNETPANHTLLLASDDPDTIVSPDLLSTLPSDLSPQRAQHRIVLASKRTLEPAVPLREPGSAYTKHVDENSGWEGGFYAALFNSLGKPRGGAKDPEQQAEYVAALTRQADELKQLVGRAYLLDLAVLGQADGVVCAVSSAACRILGVMMGLDKMLSAKWVNVDDGRGWTWDGQRD